MINFLDMLKHFQYNNPKFNDRKSILEESISEPEQSESPAATFREKRIREYSI